MMNPQSDPTESDDPLVEGLDEPNEEAAMAYDPEEATDEPDEAVVGILRRNENRLLAIDGVEGAGIQSDEIGNDMIVVYIRDSGVRSRLPKTLEGVEVRGVVSGPIDAY